MNNELTEREMLEWAAKSIGRETTLAYNGVRLLVSSDEYDGEFWNPLIDDGDALRLLLAHGMDLKFWDECDVNCVSAGESVVIYSVFGTGRNEATRLAIVKAAAEIGRSKHE